MTFCSFALQILVYRRMEEGWWVLRCVAVREDWYVGGVGVQIQCTSY